jgi:hypothetical protein
VPSDANVTLQLATACAGSAVGCRSCGKKHADLVSSLVNANESHGKCEKERVGRAGASVSRGSCDDRRVPHYGTYVGRSPPAQPSPLSPITTSVGDVRSEERRVDPIP